MTIIEAMGTGLPIVASAVGGVPDMLRDRESGLLTACDPDAVSQAVLTLIGREDLREKLGKAAKEDSKRFSAEYMAEEYCKAYQA